MAFTKQVPEWNAVGVEPPQSLKDSGWQAGVKPPADYFNWLQNKSAEAIKELQQKAGEVKTVNGQSPDAGGNVNVTVDTTNLATKQSVEDLEQEFAAHQADYIQYKSNNDADKSKMNINIIDLAIELETMKAAELTGVNANIFIETFQNLDDIVLERGKYDSANKRLEV